MSALSLNSFEWVLMLAPYCRRILATPGKNGEIEIEIEMRGGGGGRRGEGKEEMREEGKRRTGGDGGERRRWRREEVTEKKRGGGREGEKKRGRNVEKSAYQHGHIMQPPSMECAHSHSDVLRWLLVTKRWSPLPRTHHSMRM